MNPIALTREDDVISTNQTPSAAKQCIWCFVLTIGNKTRKKGLISLFVMMTSSDLTQW
jgi:hypothetical protein